MPTPFMHLYLAQQLRTRLVGDPANRDLLTKLTTAWPAFCFGNVAPDYQVLCDVPREATHFYPLPVPAKLDAGKVMLARYPELRAIQCAGEDQAAFVAGYLSHLLVDLVWYWDVLLPYFVEAADLGLPKDRMFLHNLTLIVIDRHFSAKLPAGIGVILRSSAPEGWLPFAKDGHLTRWRDYLAEQLAEDGTKETVEIYAGRMNMSPALLHKNLNDVEWLQAHLLAHVPVDLIESTLEATVDQSLMVVRDYLSDTPVRTASGARQAT